MNQLLLTLLILLVSTLSIALILFILWSYERFIRLRDNIKSQALIYEISHINRRNIDFTIFSALERRGRIMDRLNSNPNHINFIEGIIGETFPTSRTNKNQNRVSNQTLQPTRQNDKQENNSDAAFNSSQAYLMNQADDYSEPQIHFQPECSSPLSLSACSLLNKLGSLSNNSSFGNQTSLSNQTRINQHNSHLNRQTKVPINPVPSVLNSFPLPPPPIQIFTSSQLCASSSSRDDLFLEMKSRVAEKYLNLTCFF